MRGVSFLLLARLGRLDALLVYFNFLQHFILYDMI